MRLTILLASLSLCIISPAIAAKTQWMQQSNKYAPFVNKKIYGTGIECREGKTPRTSMVRFNTSPLDLKRKPFYKWWYVVTKTSKLKKEISRIRLRNHPELKYRIVDRNTFTSKGGVEFTCALLYRGTGPVDD